MGEGRAFTSAAVARLLAVFVPCSAAPANTRDYLTVFYTHHALFSPANRVDGDTNMIYDSTETTRIPGTFLFDRAFQNSSFQGDPNRVWYALYDSRIGGA